MASGAEVNVAMNTRAFLKWTDSEVLTAVLLKKQVVWDVSVTDREFPDVLKGRNAFFCRANKSKFILLEPSDTTDGGNMNLRNYGNCMHNNAASHSRRLES